MTETKNNRIRHPRGTITMDAIEAEDLETGLSRLSDTLRGLTECDIGIQEPLHVGALGLCKNTVGGLLELCERWDRSGATTRAKPMTVTEALAAMSEAEANAEAAPKTDTRPFTCIEDADSILKDAAELLEELTSHTDTIGGALLDGARGFIDEARARLDDATPKAA